MRDSKKGFIPVMITPFLDNGEVDYNGLAAITELYMESGAAGLFANCLSSEMFELTYQERLDVTKFVIDRVNNTLPVVATGTFEGAVEQQADFIRRMFDVGVQAVIINTNMMAGSGEPDTIFNNNTHRLLSLTEDIPVGFYECPVPYKRLVSPHQLQEFVATGRVIYHKDTCCDLDQVRQKLQLVSGGNPAFGFYDAYAGHAVASLKAGAAGLSCIQGNYWPELITWICENYNRPELKSEVDRAQQFLINQMDVVHHIYPLVAKYYLQKRGLAITRITRQQTGIFTSSIKTELDQLYAQYAIIQEELQLPATE